MIRDCSISERNRSPRDLPAASENYRASSSKVKSRIVDQNKPQQMLKSGEVELRSHTSALLSSSANRYRPLSRSDVSDPENLICDNCVNQKIHDQKLRVIAKEKKRDAKEEKKVHETLIHQFEAEKHKHLEKLRLYQETVRLQNEALVQKSHKEQERIAQEREVTRSALAEVDDELKVKKELQRQKNLKYYTELKDQIQTEKERKAKSDGEMIERDRKTKNVLIDDSKQKPVTKTINQAYREALNRQIQDNKATKIREKSQEQMADKALAQKWETVYANNEKARVLEKEEKKKTFMEDLTAQLNEQRKSNELERQSQVRDNRDYLNIIERNQLNEHERDRSRKLIQKEYAQQIKEQINKNRVRLQEEKEEKRQPYLTSLPMAEKAIWLLECKVCHHNYPLKMLNKPRKIVR